MTSTRMLSLLSEAAPLEAGPQPGPASQRPGIPAIGFRNRRADGPAADYALTIKPDQSYQAAHHHFTGKKQLFVACVTHGYGAALKEVRKIASSDTDPETKLRRAIDVLYEVTVSYSVGKMSPLIAEVSHAFPGVAQSFRQDYISPQERLIQSIVDEGVSQCVFKSYDERLLMHILMGPIVTLSLSWQMFGALENLNRQLPVNDLKDGHADMLINSLKNGDA